MIALGDGAYLNAPWLMVLVAMVLLIFVIAPPEK